MKMNATIRPASTHGGSIFLVFLVGIALFTGFLLLVPLGYQINHADHIYPGVYVAGVDLSGLTQAEAASVLIQTLDYPFRGKIVFQEGANLWTARPADLGLYLDARSAVAAAYQVGRSGTLTERWGQLFEAWYHGVDLPPVLLWDERAAHEYLRQVAQQIDRPLIEASLGVSGVEVVVRSGQVGRTTDVAAALASLPALMQAMLDGLVPLVVQESPPVILDASAQAEAARTILSAPLVIEVENPGEGDPGPWTFEPPVLAQMLTIERLESPEGARYQVGLNPESLRVFLQGLAPSFAIQSENARFIFNDDTRQLEVIRPSVVGRALDVDSTLEAIRQQVIQGDHQVNLVISYTHPEVEDHATAEELGIRELVSSHTSYFFGSDASRAQNIATASAQFHGVLVPPGATFSMADVLGDVSLDSGYEEAWIIFGDRTIKGVGGGVCQVSTTLFRTAFFGGYPVLLRYPHAYRVGYYEQTASGGHDSRLAGLDATVFVPIVDLQFVNDSPNWLLMETYVNISGQRLTWKFYSTSDGRTVDWQTTGLQNIVKPPDPLYEENPELKEGVIKQVDWAAEGADVSITRTVMRAGQILFTDTFATHYLPWRAVYQYGPGTEIPTPEPEDE